MAVAAAWIQADWIYSRHPYQNAKFWIDNNWIWGPAGSADVNTKHWIDNNWIWGPVGAPSVHTGYWIQDGWIYGPDERLPFLS